MLTFLLLFALAASAILIAHRINHKTGYFEDRCIPYFIIFLLCSTALICCSLSLINRQTRFEVTKSKCINAKNIADSYDNIDKDRIEAIDLMNLVYETNNLIDKHRVCSKSLWVGPWYSDEIGNLPKIQLKKVDKY